MARKPGKKERMKIQYRAPGNVKDEKEIQEKGQGR